MAKTALYQKYRSTDFDEVVGQEYVVRSIRNAVRENRAGHAYLFCGPRGTGKTTMARLLAKSINCTDREHAPCGQCPDCLAAANGTHPDIVEINAANETHVEDIRDLIDRSQLAPMMGKYKVYIIDEVHQLSSAASSALLKTLEEPPENVIFVLATTDPQKLLPTIISRCQRFDFTKIGKTQIRDHLLDIASKENITMDSEAAEMIAELSDGGMRDALSIMDQCAAYTGDRITIEDVDRIYGLTSSDEKVGLIKDIANHDVSGIIARIDSYRERGIDISRFTDAMADVLKETVIYKSTKREDLLKVIHPEQAREIYEAADLNTCMDMADAFLKTKERYRVSSNPLSCFEISCLKLALQEQTAPVVQTVVREPVRQEQAPVYQSNVSRETFRPAEPVKQPEKEPEPVQEAKKENVPVAPENIRNLSEEEILSILVQCNKQYKSEDEAVFASMKENATMQNRKYISLLESTKIAASGKDIILVYAGMQAMVNRINAETMNRELYLYLKESLNTDKMIYAITEDSFRQATSSFVTRRKEGTLPEAMKVERYTSEEEKKEESSVDKVLSLFGKENVEIIQE